MVIYSNGKKKKVFERERKKRKKNIFSSNYQYANSCLFDYMNVNNNNNNNSEIERKCKRKIYRKWKIKKKILI